MKTDNELLREYAEQGGDAAFAEVVRRQADLVYSVAFRVVAGEVALAEEVTQIVFTKVAQQAGQLARHPALEGWLHTTTRNTAINALRGEQRRRVREQEAFLMQSTLPAPDIHWSEIQPLLDEAVDQLRERDRHAVLLRFFKGLSHLEVGRELGLSEDAAKKRVERAVDNLRGHFARRGVVLSAGSLAGVMGANSVQAAPAGLAGRVTGASLAGGSQSALGGALLLALFMKTKTKVWLGVAVGLILAAVVAFESRQPKSTAIPATTGAVPKSPDGTRPPTIRSEIASPPPVPPEKVVMAGAITAKTPAVEPTFVAEPQADLKNTIATAIHFLEAQDSVGVLKTLMPPNNLAKELQGKGATSLADYARVAARDPEIIDLMAQMREVLPLVEGQTPAEISADGNRVDFPMSTPLYGTRNVEFINVDGLWYLHFP